MTTAVERLATFITPLSLDDIPPDDARIQSAMAKVSTRVSQKLTNDPQTPMRCPEGAFVTLQLGNGEQIRNFLGRPTGMPGNPISDAELEEKFLRCSDFGGIQNSRATRWLEQLWRLNQLPTVCRLLL